jgi:hypothetical protein
MARKSQAGLCDCFLAALSWSVIILTFPFSLCLCLKVSTRSKVKVTCFFFISPHVMYCHTY